MTITEERLESALRNADKAGDTKAAKTFANELVRRRTMKTLKLAEKEGFSVGVLDYAQASGGFRNGNPLNQREVGMMRGFLRASSVIESDMIADRVQDSGGPGRGLFQYEIGLNPLGADGSNAAVTAVNRYRNILGTFDAEMPEEWEKELEQAKTEDSYDFSKLSPAFQKEIFIADKLMDGKFKTSELADSDWEREDTMGQIWLSHHKRVPKDDNLPRHTQKLREWSARGDNRGKENDQTS
jgi:hypothetical protein